MAPFAVIVLFLTGGVLAPVVVTQSPIDTELGARLTPPAWMVGGSTTHLLGTDSLGRDVLSRIVYGARVSLSIAAVGIGVAAIVGTVAGMVAGYLGGWIDTCLMRVVDMTLAVHAYLLAIVLAVVRGAQYGNVVLVVVFLLWSRFARQARAETMALRGRDFVAASLALGSPTARIIFRHVLPNILNSLLVLSTLQLGFVIVLEATLSYLGAGIPPPTPSWGIMVADGRALLVSAWWVSTLPGLAIVAIVLSVNLVGDAIRDLLDPRQQKI